MNWSDLSWSRKGRPSIGDRLRDELGFTPLYLRYNTGRHISSNGQQFAQLLQQLEQHLRSLKAQSERAAAEKAQH